MSDTGWLYPQTVIQHEYAGVNTDFYWSNPDNIKAEDATYATYTGGDKQDITYLLGVNYGASIPEGATIDGIAFVMKCYSSLDNADHFCEDYELYLVQDGVGELGYTKIGSNLASGINWATSNADRTYGGATNKWGATLTRDIVVNSNFGIAYRVLVIGITVASIDSFKIKIYYTGETVAAGSKAFMHYYRRMMAGKVGRQC